MEPEARRAGNLGAAFLLEPESFRTLHASLLARRRVAVKADLLFDEALAAAHKLLQERNESQHIPMEIAAAP